jgi:hypothetical protein
VPPCEHPYHDAEWLRDLRDDAYGIRGVTVLEDVRADQRSR